MDPTTLAALQKVATALVAPSAKTAADKATLRWRVAWQTSRAARRHGIKISQTAIRTWLARDDTREALIHADGGALSAGARSLGLLANGGSQAQAKSDLLLRIVLNEYLSCVSPGLGNAAAVAWTRAEAETTRDEVGRGTERVLERISQQQSFDEALSTFHAWRVDEARKLHEHVPAIAIAISRLSSTNRRAQALTDWSSTAPQWLTPHPELYAWLASLAIDYDADGAAVTFIDAGLKEGLSPRGYWIARRELIGGEPSKDSLIAADLASPHPLSKAMICTLDGDERSAADALRDWTTTSGEDEAIRLQLLSRLVENLESTTSALGIIEPTAEGSGSSGQMLRTAELLLRRGVTGNSVHRLADAERALSLAIRARNNRRTWLGDSAAAAVMAMRAAHLSGQVERAWTITQPPPEGEATPQEASDPRLIAEAGLTAALTGRITQARRLSQTMPSKFAKAQTLAIVAEREGDTNKSREQWLIAWEAAEAPTDKLAAAMGLADFGVSVDGLEELATDFPEKVQEIRDVAQALSAAGDPRQALRAHAHKSPRIAIELAQRLYETGDYSEAGLVLEQAGDRWRNAQLMVMAADCYRRGGIASKAIDAATAALHLGGSSWPGNSRARAILVDMHASEGRYDLAADHATVMLTHDPHDVNAQWALVKCLLRRGDLKAAWEALTTNGQPAPPRDRDEATCWIGLYARFTTDPYAVSRALAQLEPWIDDEYVFGAFLMELMTRSKAVVETSDEERKAFQAALASYQERFPSSTALRAIALGPDDDPLANFREVLKTQHRDNSDLFERIQRGELPIGLLSNAYGRHYAEVALGRPVPVLTQSPTDTPPRVPTQNGAVVADTTALATITRLDSKTADVLLSRFAQIRTSDALYFDAVRGRESLELRAPMTVAWDPIEQREKVSLISEAHVDQLAKRSIELQAKFERVTRVPWHELRNFQQDLHDCVWLSAVDMAQTEETALWADDAALRGLAEALGLSTFSTADLLNLLAAEGPLTQEEVDVATGMLIYEGYSDLGFADAPMTLAAEMGAWAPAGAALTVEHPRSWGDPDEVVAFCERALEASSDQPDHIAGWVRSASIGLTVITDSNEAASANLRIFLGRIITKDFIGPAQMQFVMRGLQAGAPEVDLDQPLESVLRVLYSAYAETLGHELASQLLMNKLALCESDAKRVAARVILTSKTEPRDPSTYGR